MGFRGFIGPIGFIGFLGLLGFIGFLGLLGFIGFSGLLGFHRVFDDINPAEISKGNIPTIPMVYGP